tara:strand:+ start:1730 stop:2563 length:834 start_codon:yes stop_codon:yes gene_type:complete
MARHNKKRNVGLIYELLIRRLSRAIVESDKKTADTVKTIIGNRFKKGNELYKEFRLFNAIISTTGVNEQLAFRIIDESKSAALDHDPVTLDKEKSRLIKDINYMINEANFYDMKIENYQVYASTQQLLNLWRGDDVSITESARHEATVRDWLVSVREEQALQSEKTPSVNDLTFRVMQEKFIKKYSTLLSENQSTILRLYCEGKDDSLLSTMNEVVCAVDNRIKKYLNTSSDRLLSEKVKSVKNVISSQALSPDAESVSKVMVLDQLVTELEGITNV